MNKITIENKTYELMDNYKEAFNQEDLKKRYTDYFEEFDYILGDYSYGSLRLKGFCDKKNKLFKNYNDIKICKKYLKNNCSHECRYFILKRSKKQ